MLSKIFNKIFNYFQQQIQPVEHIGNGQFIIHSEALQKLQERQNAMELIINPPEKAIKRR